MDANGGDKTLIEIYAPYMNTKWPSVPNVPFSLCHTPMYANLVDFEFQWKNFAQLFVFLLIILTGF